MAAEAEPVEWRAAERRGARASTELARLARRGRRRAGTAALLALALGACAALAYQTRSTHHEAEIVLRVSEGAVSDDQGMPRSEVRGYVESALLTRPVLRGIVEDEELFEGLRERGVEAAVTELRDAVDIEVYGNFFAAWDSVGSRSLRIRLRYASGDRAEAAAVVRALARVVRNAELEERRYRFERGEAISDDVLARVEHQLTAREREYARRLEELHRAERMGDAVGASALRLRAEAVQEILQRERGVLEDARAGRSELELRRAAARERLGLLFTVVDERVPPPAAKRPWVAAAALGGIAFVIGFPFTLAAAGAFDRRVYERDDLARLGFEPIGSLPRGGPPDRGARSVASRSQGGASNS